MSVLSCRNRYPWACCCSVRFWLKVTIDWSSWGGRNRRDADGVIVWIYFPVKQKNMLLFRIKLVLLHSSPAYLFKNNGWVPFSLVLPLSLCSPERGEWAWLLCAFVSIRGLSKIAFWGISSTSVGSVHKGKNIFSSCLLCLARGMVSLSHWSFAALLEILKWSRSHQKLPLMGCFSWAYLTGIVCTLLLQSKWELNKVKLRCKRRWQK